MYKKIKNSFQHNWQLYILMLPALLWLVIFAYYPIYGLLLAFKDYKASMGITRSPWADPLLKHFMAFFRTSVAKQVIVNTLSLSGLTVLITFPLPIIFALFLNQLKNPRLKKTVQTISYAPYFVSNVVVVSILSVICAPSGFVNTILKVFTSGQPLYLMSSAEYFRPLYITSQLWQTLGFSAIVYIAALAGISPEYHEAAKIDGAGTMKRILYVDLPLILPTIVIMFILCVGNIMTIGYEKVYLMQAGTNTTVSEIISTYVYKVGLQNAQYSFSIAVGLFNSAVNFILLLITNQIAKRCADVSLF